MNRNVLRAGAIAGILGGLPSIVHALATGRDPMEATIATGSVAFPNESDRSKLIAAAIPIHLVVSLWWAFVMARFLPPRGNLLGAVTRGAIFGGTVGAVDLEIAAKLFPRLAALPRFPQLLDHMFYGALVAASLRRNR